MADFITLEHFHATARHYHIYKIGQTKIAHHSHYHNYYQICYVVSGEIIHRQNREAVTLRSGDAFIVPPNFTHSLHFNNEHTEMYSLSFEETLFAAGFSQTSAYQFLESLQAKATAPTKESVRLRVTLNRSQRRSIESLLECLIRHQEEDCPAGLSAAPSLVSSIIYLLAQSYYQQPQNASELDSLASYNGTLLQCVAYIDRHFREPLSLNGLTKQFGLSRSSFCSVFPQFTGMPLRKYIANKRIKEAQVLIRAYPNKPLSLIAAEVGYRDDSTFYRNFMQVTGVSPSKYKTSFHNGDNTHDPEHQIN